MAILVELRSSQVAENQGAKQDIELVQSIPVSSAVAGVTAAAVEAVAEGGLDMTTGLSTLAWLSLITRT